MGARNTDSDTGTPIADERGDPRANTSAAWKAGDHGGAAEAFARAVPRAPDNPTPLMEFGELLLEMGQLASRGLAGSRVEIRDGAQLRGDQAPR